ncbi:SabA family sialic acid-binding adhesin, partial [Helicobacter pylori]
MKKTLLLSLSLASSLLNAEDNGFFISAGYQIGEAAQMVKNTGELKKLSDTYENLSNLLTNFNNLNQAVTNASSPSEINATIDNLKANTQGLIGEKTNSPAYQAVYLALNAAVGLWNVIAYNVQCGPGKSGQQSVIFEGQPGHDSSSINCNLRGYNNGVSGPLSIENFRELNQAYQTIQQALKQDSGFPVLDSTGKQVTIKITTQTNGQTSKETTTTTNNAQTLLQEASKMISVLTTNCPWVNTTQGSHGGAPWGLNTTGNVCQVFATEFSAVTSMIKNAQEIVAQAQSLNNQQSNQNAPQDFNPYTSADRAFAQNMLNHAQAQAKMLELADQMKKDLNTIPSQFITNYLAACRNGNGTLPDEGVTNNTWGAGCAYVEETI